MVPDKKLRKYATSKKDHEALVYKRPGDEFIMKDQIGSKVFMQVDGAIKMPEN